MGGRNWEEQREGNCNKFILCEKNLLTIKGVKGEKKVLLTFGPQHTGILGCDGARLV